MKQLGIYIHIPFCVHKCYYCDFISYVDKLEKVKEYIKALKKEIELTIYKKNYSIDTIYIGGGTPSCIESKYIKEIMNKLKEYNIQQDVQISIEINPGTVNKEKLRDYLEVGINRLSIGLQSTNNKLLKQIGRIHTYETFLKTYEEARNVGFNNINVDLIQALPNQTIDILEESVKKIVKLAPEHISIYSLILEEDTILYKSVRNKEIKLVDEKLERQMYWRTKQILESNKYIHYEISNFAKTGCYSKHNMNCWEQKEYIGLGVAAHSYINKIRYSNTTNIEEYINTLKDIKDIEEIKKSKLRTIHEIQTKEEEQKEYFLLGLRKLEGINIENFKQKFIQNPIYLYRNELNELVQKDLIEIDLNNIRLTKKGLDFANIVWEKFI
ncbi:MAG: oxygen-independent coproporphyrinogen III oxidase [Clostridia bacterium]|nr:oxygen-independent coproporphyrinogen III oxidase [Clostridia bacterium]